MRTPRECWGSYSGGGRGVREDRERAVELLRGAAADGSVIAQYELAMLLVRREKIGIPPKSCYEYFLKAAVQGHAGAQAQYGSALMHGRVGGKEDPVAAEEWLRKAAMQERARAMRDLARCQGRIAGAAQGYPQEGRVMEVAVWT
jgi:TPR repeat protein